MISVIIPTLNEEKHLPMLINDLNEARRSFEIIVVDGGSKDNTIDIADSLDVQLISTTASRAHQMNFGARKARFNHLLFLHADSRLPPKTIESLFLNVDKLESGCFRLKFDQSNAFLSIYSAFSKLNNYIFTYGDQGLIVKKELFYKVGGFRAMPIMEDIDIVRRLKKQCEFKKLKEPIYTSSRRFESNGFVYQQIKNIMLVFLYLLGVSPKRLSKFYQYS